MNQTKHKFNDDSALTNVAIASEQMTWKHPWNQKMHLIKLVAHCTIVKADGMIYCT